MKARVLFGVFGFAFVLLALYVFPPIVLECVLLALCALATHEFLGSTGLVKNRLLLGVCEFFSELIAFENMQMMRLFYSSSHQLLLFGTALLFIVSLFCVLLRHHDTISVNDLACGFLGGMIIPFMLLSLMRIFQMENGQYLVLLPLIAAWGSDTCALFAGMLFGKHKLAPVVSPKKTVEGAIGGVVGAAAIMLGVTALLARYTTVSVSVSAALLLGVLGAVIGQIGDLSFSIVKRQTGIKDYGTIFPGHGGVLDRFDSVIFVAPIVELILLLV